MNVFKGVFEYVPCNLCGHDDYTKLTERGLAGEPAHLVICNNCGLGYLNPRWTKESYDAYYALWYDKIYRKKSQSPGTGLMTGQYDFKKIRVIHNRMKEAGMLSNTFANILDIGTGDGSTLVYLRNDIFPDAKLFAIEPSPDCRANLEKENITVISTDVDSQWDTGYRGKFDLIIMRHVLEHFMDPLLALKKIKETLAPGGILYLAVPDSLNPRLPLSTIFIRSVHTYYFNRFTLTNYLAKAGLFPLKMAEVDIKDAEEIFAFIAKADQPILDMPFEGVHEQIKIFQDILREESTLLWKLKDRLRLITEKILYG